MWKIVVHDSPDKWGSSWSANESAEQCEVHFEPIDECVGGAKETKKQCLAVDWQQMNHQSEFDSSTKEDEEEDCLQKQQQKR